MRSTSREMRTVPWSVIVLTAIGVGVSLRGVLYLLEIEPPGPGSAWAIVLLPLCAAAWTVIAQDYLRERRLEGIERLAIERAAALSFVVALTGVFAYNVGYHLVRLPSLSPVAMFLGLTVVFCASDVLMRHRLR